MQKQTDEYGNEKFIVEQCDFDNSLSLYDIEKPITKVNIVGGVGHSVFEDIYKSKYTIIDSAYKELISKLIKHRIDDDIRLNNYNNLCNIYDKDTVDKMLKTTNCSLDDLESYLKIVTNLQPMQRDILDILKELSEEYEAKQIPPSIDSQIANLKSQLKHCKHPLQKLNMEREMNRLIRERRIKNV